MKYNRGYIDKVTSDPLPSVKSLIEANRIYFDVPYMAKSFAKFSGCCFDAQKKLWFTGIHNSSIQELIDLYGLDDATSSEMIELLKSKGYKI